MKTHLSGFHKCWHHADLMAADGPESLREVARDLQVELRAADGPEEAGGQAEEAGGLQAGGAPQPGGEKDQGEQLAATLPAGMP